MRPKRKSVTRSDFIRALHRNGHMTYRRASEVFDLLVDTIGTAVLNRQQVDFGKVGRIVPTVANAKTVCMNFTSRKRQIMLGQRVRFKFKVHRKFLNTHQVDWF